jgi:hypothetical protein
MYFTFLTRIPYRFTSYIQQILCEARIRNFALIYLQYGVYDSPIPASFMRVPASADIECTPPPMRPLPSREFGFQPDEYITLILTSEIAEGTTGKVHGATLEVQTLDGNFLTDDVVVKLAFLDHQKERLRNEHDIYQHLALKDVKGLPTTFGLFDDLEGGPSLLITTHAGTCVQRGQGISPSQRYVVPSFCCFWYLTMMW